MHRIVQSFKRVRYLIIGFASAMFLLAFIASDAQKAPVKQQLAVSDTLSLDTIALQVERFLNEQLEYAISPNKVADTVLLKMLFSSGYADINMEQAYEELYGNQSKTLKRDLGFRLVANFQENFEPGFSSEEDLAFLRRMYAGVEWDLLNSGLFANRARAKAIQSELEIKKIEAERIARENDYMFLYSYITYLFKKQKVELLARRQDVLDEQVLIGRKLYYLRATSWESLLELQSKAQEVNALRNNNQVYLNKRLKTGMSDLFMDDNMIYDHLPILEIDPEKMINLFNTSGIDAKIRQLRLEKVGAEYFRFNDYSVKPYLRYNYQQLENTDVKQYASVGVTASIPLKLGGARRNELESQRKIIENEEEIKRFGAGNELLNHFYEYQFKKMQYTSFHFKKLLIDERLRKELVMRDFKDEAFSPLRVLQILDERLSVEVEMVDLKKDMYLKMLKIFMYLDIDDPNKFVKVLNPHDFGKKYYGNRNLYVWSEMFNQMANDQLLAFLKNNDVKEILLSPGTQVDNDKFSDFVVKAYTQGMKVHLMIGDNNLLNIDADARLRDKLGMVKGLPVEGLHLDVEPQTLPDYRQNTQGYNDKLVEILNKARAICNEQNLQLSASVPLSFDQAMLTRVYDQCDKVYLMAYEHPDIDYVKRKTADALAISPKKSIIALSPSDFSDRLSMEMFIERLLLDLKMETVAIHDLRRLVEIDNRSIQKVK